VFAVRRAADRAPGGWDAPGVDLRFEPFEGFHWCAYGLADRFAATLQQAGVVVSAVADDAGVEAIELPDHPFFLATAFQPQAGSAQTGRLHPCLAHFYRRSRAIAWCRRRPAHESADRPGSLDRSYLA
jgi:hypothetical protein